MSRHGGRRWLVTGAGGLIGGELVRALAGEDVVAVDREGLDITEQAAVRALVAAVRPTLVVNAAGFTAVDRAEAEESAAMLVNAAAPGWLAAAASEVGARTIQLSTDYVFAGDATEPYVEDAPTRPLSAYGRSKAAGERAVLAADPAAYVVRTSWVYGATGRNFVTTMAAAEAAGETVSVVDDQHGSPTWAQDLALGLVELGRSQAPPGVYHCTGAGATSWFGLARAVFAELGADPARVAPVTTAQAPRPARRPAYAVLSNGRWQAAGLPPLPPWRDSLHEFLAAQGAG